MELTADNVVRGELHAAKLSLGKHSSLSQMSFLLETDRRDRTNLGSFRTPARTDKALAMPVKQTQHIQQAYICHM